MLLRLPRAVHVPRYLDLAEYRYIPPDMQLVQASQGTAFMFQSRPQVPLMMPGHIPFEQQPSRLQHLAPQVRLDLVDSLARRACLPEECLDLFKLLLCLENELLLCHNHNRAS